MLWEMDLEINYFASFYDIPRSRMISTSLTIHAVLLSFFFRESQSKFTRIHFLLRFYYEKFRLWNAYERIAEINIIYFVHKTS